MTVFSFLESCRHGDVSCFGSVKPPQRPKAAVLADHVSVHRSAAWIDQQLQLSTSLKNIVKSSLSLFCLCTDLISLTEKKKEIFPKIKLFL